MYKRSEDRKRIYQRLGEKTLAHQFVETIKYEFELSPRVSRGIYDVVEETFLEKQKLREGQIQYVVVEADEGSGPSMSGLKKKVVILTRDGSGDIQVAAEHGRRGLRKAQLLRMTEEAYDQGALLTQEDVGRVLGVSSRTIRRDVSELMKTPVKLYLRGIQQDIGRGISHKVWIVGLYLKWKTYSEIKWITGHSEGSIKTYLHDFTRVLMARERGIESPGYLTAIRRAVRNFTCGYFTSTIFFTCIKLFTGSPMLVASNR